MYRVVNVEYPTKKFKQRKTSVPELTPVERARLIGERAVQIERGADTTMNKKQYNKFLDRILNPSSVSIAAEELRLKVIPLKVIRVLPSGREEVWEIDDFYDTPSDLREDIFTEDIQGPFSSKDLEESDESEELDDESDESEELDDESEESEEESEEESDEVKKVRKKATK